MPRGATTYNTEAEKTSTSPVILVRLLNIPLRSDPTDLTSLYLTDCEYDITHFDEAGLSQSYTSCGLSYSQVSVNSSNEISTAKIKVDNVNRDFSALAQLYKLQKIEVHVLRAFRDTVAYSDGSVYLFIGHANAPVIGEHKIEVSVKTDFSLSQKLPRRMFWPRDFPYLPASKDIRNPL